MATDPPRQSGLALPGAREALNQADELVTDGRYRDAIELLTRVNRARPNLAVERRLVSLRHEAFFDLESTGLDTWPPAIEAPLAPEGTIPEISRAELSVDTMKRGIVGNGALLVRGLIDTEDARELVDGIDRALTAFQAWDPHSVGSAHGIGAELANEHKPYFRPFRPIRDNETLAGGRSFVREGSGCWTADSPRMLFTVIEMLHDAGFVEAVEAYIGEPAAISVKKSTLRIVPPDSGTNWHQDGAFLGDGIRTCNLWLALSDCGEDSPSLDVVPKRMDAIAETGTEGAAFDWSVGQGTVDRVAGSAPIIRPVFAPGDALLFDEMFLHRTGVGEMMSRPRYAIESWFFGASAYPVDQVPLLI